MNGKPWYSTIEARVECKEIFEIDSKDKDRDWGDKRETQDENVGRVSNNTNNFTRTTKSRVKQILGP